jgi:D-alanyl-D-alanine carboxypeptidase
LFSRLFFAIAFLSLAELSSAAYHPVNATIVVNAETGEVIYSYNADLKTQPASLAKMMTLLLAFKALQRKKISLTTKIPISAYAASQKPSILGLKSGEFITVQNAILALIVKSANDIAVALAEYLGKTEKSFVCMMNKEAQRLGMSSTIFFNASGWKDPRQVTTARNMAKLSCALINEYPAYYHFFASRQFDINGKSIKGHYALLGQRGDVNVDGIKTGFVNASRYNVAASASKNGKRLVAVVLGGRTSKGRDELASLLLQKGFLKLRNRELVRKLESAKSSTIVAAAKALSTQKTEPPLAATVAPVMGIYNKIGKLN